MDDYDAIVIGGGLAGLSSAAYLAKAGKKVIVLEQDSRPGGFYTSFFRNGVVFDITAHWTVDHDKVNRLLAELNTPQVDFTRHVEIGEYIGPEKKRGVLLTDDRGTFERSMFDNYPEASRGSVDRLIDLSLRVEEELGRAEPLSADLVPFPIRAWRTLPLLFRMRTVLKYARVPAEEFLQGLFPGESLKGLRAALYTIAPIRNIPAIGLLVFIGFALRGRAYEPVGGAYKVVEAFTNAVTANGGEVRCSTKVKNIDIEGKRVSGVLLDDGRKLSADHVVAAISARQTFEQLVDPGLVPGRYRERLRSTPLSDPYFIASIVTDIDLPKAGKEPVDMFISASYDLREGLALNSPERSFFSIQFPKYHTTDGDPMLHGVQIVAPASFEHQGNWRTGPELIRGEEYSKLKEQFAQKLLDRAEEYIPGLKEHILSIDLATPVTMYRYTLSTAGAPVGWSYASRQRWRQRIPFVKGLYGAGQWYGPSGIYNVTLSGKNAATLILREQG